MFPLELAGAFRQEPIPANEAKSDSRSPLLLLPSELRQEIYTQIFHEWHGDDLPCNIFLEGRGNVGCWCGNGLSLANHQLYNETRHVFYRCIRLSFMHPVACELFLRKFGKRTEWVTSLKVAFANAPWQAWLFRDIFRYLGPNSNLHYLELRVLSWDLEQFPPIYSTSLPQPLQQAAKYNLSFRPATHLLAKLRSISSLTVIGHPTGEMEEAIFKLSMEMEERGKNEGKQVEKVDTKIEEQSLGKSPWFYKIQIKD